MNSQDLCYLPATELVKQYRRRGLSPVEVMDAVTARIEKLNPVLNAYCTLTLESAREAAQAAEAKLMRGEPIGSLHGVPVSIKDHQAVKGVRTTRGSCLSKDWIPDYDSPLVERLKAAGAIILGKTNMSESGWKGHTDNPLFGVTRNPWSLECSAGGSSGGASAAIAAGMGIMAHGADGAGSIRLPASFCGVYGLKPSLGLVPQFPRGSTDSLSHDGPMTWTVSDAALMLDVMAGPDDRDRLSLPKMGISYAIVPGSVERAVKGLRIAWSADLGYANPEPEVVRICEQAAKKFTDLGCVVDGVTQGFRDPYSILQPLYYAAEGAGWKDYEKMRDPKDPGLLALIEEGKSVTAYDYGAAIVQRSAFYEEMRRLMVNYDLLLTPTVKMPAIPLQRIGLDSPDNTMEFLVHTVCLYTYPFNLTGQPAATLPAGFTETGLPVGLQVVGKRFADATVLQACAAFERIAPWADKRPSLP